MQNEDKASKPSFWTTVPGVLTAVAALIGAAAALITALYTTGYIGPKNKPPDNPPANIQVAAEAQPIKTGQPEETTPGEVSRNFMFGRWQVEQVADEVRSGTVTDYHADGTFTGETFRFVGGKGEREPTAGRWEFEKLSKETFLLKLQYEDESTWSGNFKIIDNDHIHNIHQNYVAVRVK